MSRHPERSVTRRLWAIGRLTVLAATVMSVSLGLAGCTGLAASPASTPTSPTSAIGPTPTSTASSTPVADPGPTLVPDGSADDNLPLFAAATAAVWASADKASGRAYIGALTAAGFDKAAMQVTRDTSTVGNPAESIQFSVRWGDECLMGQVGPATGEAVALIMAGIGEGTCLVGETRPIDW